MRYVDTAEMGGNMNPAGADVAITDTMPPTLVTQLAPDRATAGQATITAAPAAPVPLVETMASRQYAELRPRRTGLLHGVA